MALPSTPHATTTTTTSMATSVSSPSLFGASSTLTMASETVNGSLTPPPSSNGLLATPASTASSTNTFLMPNSPPIKATGGHAMDGYRPTITRTLGQRPACLVNASVTYCGDNRIYAFGGFDQYSDEVYNHVLKLDLVSHQWQLVDNFGDIPGVRMGHTATLYQGDKLLVFGGENELGKYLSDLIIFDLNTAHWHQPLVSGPIPKDRARHAAVLHEDRLYIIGGISHNSDVLNDICFLDLKTFTWSRAWRFVGRFDHTAFIWNQRIWVYGGLSEDMNKTSDIWWLDLKGNPAFESPPTYSCLDRGSPSARARSASRIASAARTPVVGSSGYAANTSSVQVVPPSFMSMSPAPVSPGAISSVKFVSGPNIPSQGSGMHFHVYTSGTLLDFVTPAATIALQDCSLSALDLDTMKWQKFSEGLDFFRPGYRWHYCTLNEDGTKAWLLGCPTDPSSHETQNGFEEEYLSDIMEIDLKKYGLLGNDLTPEVQELSRPASTTTDRIVIPPSRGLGADLARLFNQHPDSGSGTDFIVTANRDDDGWMDEDVVMGRSEGNESTWLPPNASTSPPIYVHKLILQARWPHFSRLWNAQMAEFHTKKMHIPEPYSVVKAFLFYLYTDSINPEDCPNLDDVAGLLVMSNIYNLPNLRLLCINRLSKELDLDHACAIWHCADLAGEEWLKKRAAQFCLLHWGRVVRTAGFLRLPRQAIVELSQETDMEGRVVGGDELEVAGALGGGRLSMGSMTRKESVSSSQTQPADDDDFNESDEGMEMS